MPSGLTVRLIMTKAELRQERYSLAKDGWRFGYADERSFCVDLDDELDATLLARELSTLDIREFRFNLAGN